MKFLHLLPLLLLTAMGIAVGLFLFLKPGVAIETQKKLYAKANWRVEPIVLQEKITSTKIWGIYLVVITILLVGLFLMNMP